jgi:hypothetical protein
MKTFTEVMTDPAYKQSVNDEAAAEQQRQQARRDARRSYEAQPLTRQERNRQMIRSGRTFSYEHALEQDTRSGKRGERRDNR